MEREKIFLTDEDLEDFDFTGGNKWELRGEKYIYVETIRTDECSDGPSWDTIVQRVSDHRFFKWNCWVGRNYDCYQMENGDNFIEEVFPKIISKTIYE